MRCPIKLYYAKRVAREVILLQVPEEISNGCCSLYVKVFNIARKALGGGFAVIIPKLAAVHPSDYPQKETSSRAHPEVLTFFKEQTHLLPSPSETFNSNEDTSEH